MKKMFQIQVADLMRATFICLRKVVKLYTGENYILLTALNVNSQFQILSKSAVVLERNHDEKLCT
jgi:hypothetical protein